MAGSTRLSRKTEETIRVSVKGGAPGGLWFQDISDRRVTFRRCYNQDRPHGAASGKTPLQAFEARLKAHPLLPGSGLQYRVRRDKLDGGGKVTIRYLGRLRHLHVSYRRRRQPVTLLIAGPHLKVVAEDGSILRELTLDAERNYQRVGQQTGSTMSRDIGQNESTRS